ncbi:MAG: DUF5679 domain-containing protein [Chloroflexota bacterium]|nr:DUF5679 domain-containing protein [Chloroflexota bacterium]
MTAATTSDQIYCLKCRARTDTMGSRQVLLKNGSSAVSGQCAICGAKKFRIGSAEERPPARSRIARLFSKFPGRSG